MPGEVAESPGPPDPPAQPSPPGPPSPSMAVPVNTALARRPMKKESGVNLDFRNWARSLPTDRRNEIIQKIVSRRVIGNTSAKTAVKKLSAKAVVRLEKLDVLRCVINHYAQHSRSATPSSESVQEVVPVRIKSPTKVAFEKPCPLSRKRRLTMQSPHIQDKQPKLIDLSEENVKDKEPDTPAVDGLPQRLENCQKVTATPSCSGETPKKCADDTAVVRSESAKQPPLSRSLPVRESPLKQISSSSQAETPTAEHLESSRPGETIPPKKQSASMAQKSQQPPLLTARIIDSEIADVALAIAATETELVKLHEQLVSFERLGPSSKKNTRTINALLESSAILENKAKCVKSCVDKGVMRKLGNAFYPRLLQEVQKNQKLNLYSNMRLMSMVNMLLGLSLPNSDPRHTLSAFVAKSLYDQRPRAQGTTEAAPRILPVKPAAQVSVIMENTTQPSCSQPPVPVASRRENSINQVPHDFNHRSQAPPGPQPHPSVTVGQVVSNLVTSHVRASQVENQMNGMEQLTTFQHVMKTMPQQVANSNSGNYVIMPSQKTGNQVILASSQVQVSQVFSKGPSQPQVRTAQLTETTQRLYPPQLQQSQQAVFQQQHYQQQDSPQQIQQQLHQMQLQQRQHQQRQLQQRQLQQLQLQQQQALQKQPLQLTQQLQQQFQPNQLPQQPQQLQQRPLQHHFQLQQQQLQQQQLKQQQLKQQQLQQQQQQQQLQQQQLQQQQLQQQQLQQQQLQQQQLQLHQAPQLPVQQQYQTNQQITAPQFQQHLYVQVQQPFVHGFQTQQFQLQPQNIVSHQTYTQVQERGQPVNAVLSGGVPFRQSGVQVIPNVSPVARATSRDSGIETPELH